MVVEPQDFGGNLIVSVVQFRFGGLFNGTAVQGETGLLFSVLEDASEVC